MYANNLGFANFMYGSYRRAAVAAIELLLHWTVMYRSVLNQNKNIDSSSFSNDQKSPAENGSPLSQSRTKTLQTIPVKQIWNYAKLLRYDTEYTQVRRDFIVLTVFIIVLFQ